MCGIAGTIDAVEARATERVTTLNMLQQHRGPDHTALARVGSFTLGNTRLAIQDPGPDGNQPFVSPDGRYHCVFNGEIYNYRRLVDHYALPVRTACDGEIIPLMWAKLGPAALAQLRGMFAIAIADSLEERLYLARDPFGIKPLYWRILSDGCTIFASEVRPLTRLATGVHISGEAIVHYLRFGALAADQSPFDEIRNLPPNSMASFDKDGQVLVRPILPDGPLAACTTADLGSAIADSTELHLAADVPTALLLSSGADSATIAAIGSQLGRTLHCITVATEGAADESNAAAQTARHYGHDFQRVPAALEDGDVSDFFNAMQRPTIDGLNTYLVCKAVHNVGFKVALSGLGGDEAVGGYGHFRLLKYLRFLKLLEKMPDPVVGAHAWAAARLGIVSEAKARRLLGVGGPRDGSGLSLLQREVLHPALVSELSGMEVDSMAVSAVPWAGPSTSFGSMVAAEVAIYLQAMLLPDADAFSMASSVELRVPFVDSHVFAAALAIAGDSAHRPGKAIIAALLDDSYLGDLAARPKLGFSMPMRKWMSGPLAHLLKAVEDPAAPVWRILDRQAAIRARVVSLTTPNRWANIWVIAALNAWLETTDCCP